MKHHCHVRGCPRACPPRHLTCLYHWNTVSPETQKEVYRTVKLRGRGIDASWAPWWRAQAKAIYEAMLADPLYDNDRAKKVYERDASFADELESQ